MILSMLIGLIASYATDAKIDDLFPNIGGSTNLTARYTVGGLCVWGAFAWMTQDWPEPWRTKGRHLIGLSFLAVGLGVSARRIGEACK